MDAREEDINLISKVNIVFLYGQEFSIPKASSCTLSSSPCILPRRPSPTSSVLAIPPYPSVPLPTSCPLLIPPLCCSLSFLFHSRSSYSFISLFFFLLLLSPLFSLYKVTGRFAYIEVDSPARSESIRLRYNTTLQY